MNDTSTNETAVAGPLFERDWHAEAARKCGRDVTAGASSARRDGNTFDADRDAVRLGRQHRAIYELMRDGRWRTLADIEEATGHPQASISARLRDFRKARFGGHVLNRQRRGAEGGTYEYQLEVTR